MSASAIPIFKEKETFYVPTFQIKIGGQDAHTRDITEVTYNDKADDLDSVEFVVNNWDGQAGKPKYEPPSSPKYRGLFDPGQSLELTLGYAGNTKNDRLMLRGEITSIEPNFPESGAPTLTVHALNSLAKYRKKQHSWGFDKHASKRPGSNGILDSEIVKLIASWPVSEQKPGLKMDVQIDGKSGDAAIFEKEEERPFVMMNNQWDILFVIQLARSHGYQTYVKSVPDPKSKSGAQKERLEFARSTAVRNVTYRLDWGTSLVEFRPIISTSNQVSKVRVMGFERAKGKPITGKAEWGKNGITMNRDDKTLARVLEGREEVITDIPVFSQKEADSVAAAILQNKLFRMIKATGTTVGLPDLRAGGRVVIGKLGDRLSGVYMVTETTHRISDGGYRTNFSARREKPMEVLG
jgi:uncharacterized protein